MNVSVSFRRAGTLRLLIVTALVVIVVLVLGLCVYRSRSGMSQSAQVLTADQAYSQWPMETTKRSSVLFAGDDFAAGYGGVGRNAYPYILCNSVGLNCFVDAQTGTGLINDGRAYGSGTQRLIDRLPMDASLYNADVLILDAGRNDSESLLWEYVAALEDYLEEAKRVWPEIMVFVVLPMYPSAGADPQYAARAVAVTDVVEWLGGVVIDPIALGWYAEADLPSFFSSGDGHPNQQGHALIARKLADVLAGHGIGQSGVVN